MITVNFTMCKCIFILLFVSLFIKFYFLNASTSMADTLHSRPVNQRIIRDRLSLWEAKTNPTAPLTSKQKDALMELTAIAAERPLPPEVGWVMSLPNPLPYCP